MPVSHSLYQNLDASSSSRQSDRHTSMMCRHCNKQHGNDKSSSLRRSGSAGVSIVEGNDQSCVFVSDEASVLRSNSEELLDDDCCPPAVCLSCHSQRFGVFSCDRNDCDVLEQAVRKHQCCLHGRCMCSLSFYFSCVTDCASDAGTDRSAHSDVTSPSHQNSQSSQRTVGDVRPRTVQRTSVVQNPSNASSRSCNLSRRVHHFIHHLNRINDEPYSVNSHSPRDPNSAFDVRSLDRRRHNGQRSRSPTQPVANRLDSLPVGHPPEAHENEHNDNIENGRVMSRHSCRAHDNNNVSPVRHHSNVCDVMPRSKPASRGQSVRGSGGSISILPLLLRSANTIDEMDQQAVMELSSMLHHE